MPGIITIVGARPQFIKAALISRDLRDRGINEKIVHTGQHYDFNMSDIFFRELSLPAPDYHLGVGSGNHGEQTGRMLTELEKVFLKERPDAVLVYGDTNTTLAASLAAAKLHIPVAHVEAGLRSYNKAMPEEVNRVVTDHLSELLFCPSEVAVSNLIKEGFTKVLNDGRLVSCSTTQPLNFAGRTPHPSPVVINVGDVMFDLASKIIDTIDEEGVLEKFTLHRKGFILVTIHRAENTDVLENLEAIWDAIVRIAETGTKVFFPVHPRTLKAFQEAGLKAGTENIRMSAPVSYTEMIALEKNAKVVLTDSGGVQKEAYFFKTPCIIPRKETEWVELADSGWTVLTGPNSEAIVNAVGRLSGDARSAEWKPCYGDGHAADRIVQTIQNYFSL